jgi:uncharacterized protein DUF4395
MNYRLEKSGTTFGNRAVLQPGSSGLSGGATSLPWREAARRNFILQMGFEDPDPAARSRQYSALVFQPKVVLVTILAGILFQSPAVFTALGAVLWWSAFLPNLSPFTALYNAILGRRPGAFHLGPAPAPRRSAEMTAGAFAMATALLAHAGFSLAANVLAAIFLAAALAVVVGSFCLGTFMFHLLRGRRAFVRQTLPWAR